MGRATKRNKLTDAESIAAINPENVRLIDDFIEYLHSTQKAPTTIAVYRNDLEIAMVWSLKHNRNKEFVKWTKRDVLALQGWLINENENSPARVRRIKATLSSLSNYIEAICDDEYPDFRNIIHKVESPAAQAVREKTVLSDEQIKWLLDELVERKQYEKACMLALASFSGRRKAELVRFKVDYFTDDNIIYGSLYRTPEKIKTKGRGNGKYLTCFTLAKDFKPYLDLWMEKRKMLGIESEWLFPDKGNPAEHMDASTLDSWANTFGRMLGVDFYFHSLRHYFTTHLVRQGLPDSVIQSIIGWTSADMLRIYTDISVEEQLGQYFDEDGIKQVETKKISDL